MKLTRNGSFIFLVLAGFFIGTGMIMPGVSGGVIAIILGLYQPIINVIAHPFRDLDNSFKLGIPLGLGAVFSIVVFSNTLDYLLTHYPIPLVLFFIGLMLGSIPSVVSIANEKGFDKRYLSTLVFGLAIIVIPFLFQGTDTKIGSGQELTLWQGLVSGFFIAVGTVVPGISSSFLLMIYGTYQSLLRALASFNVIALVPTAIGFAVAALFTSRVASYLLREYYGWTYYALLGILIGSVIAIFPGVPESFAQGIVSIFLFIIGFVATWNLQKLKT